MIILVCYTVNMFTKESLFGGVHGYRVVLQVIQMHNDAKCLINSTTILRIEHEDQSHVFGQDLFIDFPFRQPTRP